MKTARMLLIMVLVLVGLGTVARSQTSIHVYGADDPAIDVQAVQDAVDTYDIVYLHGTFDFENSQVYITHSVEIIGEGTDVHGEYLTKIEGGGLGALSSASSDNPDVEWTVRDIEFNGARRAILTTYSKRFEVTGCRISVSSNGWANGICMNGPGGVWGTHVTGSVSIKDNYIDLSCAGKGGIGIMAQMIYADIEVVGNTVENSSTSGLWINSAGNIEITDNTINAGPAQPTSYRNGILVGSWFLGGDKGDIEVTDNTITTGGHGWDNGIVVEDGQQELRDVCKVEDNTITYVDGSLIGSGILLLNHTSNWTFEDNTIDGGGHDYLTGILVDSECDLNWFFENKIKDITGEGIILKGDYNIVGENKFDNIGGQNIVDEGIGNVIEDND